MKTFYLRPVLWALKACAIFLSFNLMSRDLTFGIYASEKASILFTKFQPIIEYLESELRKAGFEGAVNLKIVHTYEEGIQAIQSGAFDFARLGPASYLLAYKANPHLRLLAIESAKHSKFIKGVFITRKESGIKNIKDIKGRSFAFGDKDSTIGRFLSQSELLKNQVTSKNLRNFQYLDRHDKVAAVVIAGEFDAGVVHEQTYKDFAHHGLIKIAEFDNLTKPWIAHPNMGTTLINVLKSVLLNLKDKEILKDLKFDGFLEIEHSEFDFVGRGMVDAEKF